MLSIERERWTKQEWQLDVDESSYKLKPICWQAYRIVLDDTTQSYWVCTPDYNKVVRFKLFLNDAEPSHLEAHFVPDRPQVLVQRIGRGYAKWVQLY